MHDFIPKRHLPAEMEFEKRSKIAEEAYRTKINEIVHKLVHEYKAVFDKEDKSRSANNPPDDQVSWGRFTLALTSH